MINGILLILTIIKLNINLVWYWYDNDWYDILLFDFNLYLICYYYY